MAATLIDSDNDGIIDGVNDLAVDGSLFDVEFVYGDPYWVYSDGFDFTNESAAFRMGGELLTVLFLNSLPYQVFEDDLTSHLQFTSRELFIGYNATDAGISGFEINTQDYTGISTDDNSILGHRRLIARFHEQPTAPNQAASTPEPSLILGFITLGGLMLGSKRKTKG